MGGPHLTTPHNYQYGYPAAYPYGYATTMGYPYKYSTTYGAYPYKYPTTFGAYPYTTPYTTPYTGVAPVYTAPLTHTITPASTTYRVIGETSGKPDAYNSFDYSSSSFSS